MELKLYNTLTRRKEVFKPLRSDNVRMYVCGPTVYDYAHIGNARPVIVFDVLFRLLRHIYGESHVTYVRNITDIDDKIIARAHELQGERNVPIADVMRELTEKTYRQYNDDVAALGCLPPTFAPRATEYVPRMIAMIEQLIAAGHAYPAEGHVLYDVASKPDYGKLANRSVDEMIAGARVDVAPYKKSPMDFVLWKPSDAATPGWDSPWGRGRPGWHIECSAMSEALLGETFDIHGGGIDLVFPHHENEIAQSEGAHHGHPLAKVWMHNGFLQVEGEKMSKSLGNFITINELLAKSIGSAMRLAMLQTHYRQPIDWTASRLDESERELIEWTRGSDASELSNRMALAERGHREGWQPNRVVVQALADDLNTSNAIMILRELASSDDREGNEGLFATAHWMGLFESRSIGSYFRMGQGVATSRPSGAAHGPKLINELPLVDELRAAWINRDIQRVTKIRDILAAKGHTVKVDEDGYVHGIWKLDYDAHIQQLVVARAGARAAKDFKRADEIRAELDAMGIQLKDSKDPKTGEIVTTWELKR